jgi:hypothetical protein
MVSSGLLRRVALVRTDVSEEPGASFIRGTKIGELGTTQAVTSNRGTQRKNLKSYIALICSALYRRSNVFPVKYELGFYIPEGGIPLNRYSSLAD